MLVELNVTHFAVIDRLSVHFLRPGLNILTGETGAGKSILLKSLALLLGGKASPDMIRAGHEQAVIEGAFDLSFRPDIKEELSQLELSSGDDSLVIRRIISRSGKHRLYVNGSLSTLNILEKIISDLVEITGQHEHQSLTKAASQLQLLDTYAGLLDLRKDFSALYSSARKLRDDIESLNAAARERDQRLDFLRFQLSEIEAFNPVPGEDNELNNRHQRARFASRLISFAQKGEGALYSEDHSVHSVLQTLIQEGDSLVQLDPNLKTGVQAMREAAILIEDAAYGLRDYSKHETLDEEELEKVEDRLSQLKKLQKKYGSTIDEMIEFRNRARQEYDSLEKHDETLKDLQAKLKSVETDLKKKASELHDKRVKAARKLAAGINGEIQDLNMKGTEFSLSVRELSDINSTGQDDVSFMIQNSSKDEPKPISKIASGGELSRLMLAIKQVVASGDKHMTYLFDEVDTGVSGPTAEKVGKKLKAIGSYHQVISITHLPQVASFADAHFLISKEVSKGHVESHVKELGQKERIQELGRLISGEKITAASLAHAKEMLEAHQTKSKTAAKSRGASSSAH